MIVLSFHLVDDHLGNGIARLQRVRHAHGALRCTIADDGDGKVKRDAAVFPNADGGAQDGVPIHNVRGMVGRTADDGDARGVGIETVIDGGEGAIGLDAVQLVRAIQKGSDGDGFVGFALDVVAIGVDTGFDNF